MNQKKANKSPERNERLSFLRDVVPSDGSVDCQGFENRVNDLLDQRKLPQDDQLLSEHADDCPECFQLLHEYVSVNDSLKLLKEDIAALMDSGGRPEVSPATRKTTWRVIGLITAVALMVFGAWWLDAGPGHWQQENGSGIIAYATPANQDAEVAALLNEVPGLSAVGETRAGGRFVVPFTGMNLEIPKIHPVEFELPLNEFAGHLEQFRPYVMEYSSGIHGVVPGSAGTLNMTWAILKTISERGSAKTNDRRKLIPDPDLGWHAGSRCLAMA